MSTDIELSEQVTLAHTQAQPLRIVGGNSKSFLGNATDGDSLDVRAHTGIISYEPSELVITAKAGTPLREIEAALHEHSQWLAFEPPHFGADATLGGTIAAGLSGPARPWSGSARDFVLGVRCINGKGEILKFGGQVMKNVAGYDVSRLMVGAMGTLGVLLDISLKVLPTVEQSLTLQFELAENDLSAWLRQWSSTALPLTAACHHQDTLRLRLSGTPSSLDAAHALLGADARVSDDQFWNDLREHRLSFFESDKPLWRVSLQGGAQPLPLHGDCLYDWGGAQRWLLSDERATVVRAAVEACGGHATLFRQADLDAPVFHPLPTGLRDLQRRVKRAFDPAGILNPRRFSPDW